MFAERDGASTLPFKERERLCARATRAQMLNIEKEPASGFAFNLHRQVGITIYKRGERALWLRLHFNLVKTLKQFLPENPQLQLRQTITHAPVHAKSEGQMLTRIGSLNV